MNGRRDATKPNAGVSGIQTYLASNNEERRSSTLFSAVCSHVRCQELRRRTGLGNLYSKAVIGRLGRRKRSPWNCLPA